MIPRDVLANILDYDLQGRKFELYSRLNEYSLEKVIKAMGLIESFLLFFTKINLT